MARPDAAGLGAIVGDGTTVFGVVRRTYRKLPPPPRQKPRLDPGAPYSVELIGHGVWTQVGPYQSFGDAMRGAQIRERGRQWKILDRGGKVVERKMPWA